MSDLIPYPGHPKLVQRPTEDWRARAEKAEARVRELEAAAEEDLFFMRTADAQAERNAEECKRLEARIAKLEAVAEAARDVRDDERRVAESWQMWETEPLYLRLHSALEALDAWQGVNPTSHWLEYPDDPTGGPSDLDALDAKGGNDAK